jgi:hypothetical protein
MYHPASIIPEVYGESGQDKNGDFVTGD